MNFDPSMVSSLLKNRRSIYTKFFTGARVPDEVIHDMLENANWAPTHKMTEPWRFKVFCDGGLTKLGEMQTKIFEEHFGQTPDETQLKKLKGKPLECSHVISIGMKRNPVIPIEEEISSVAAAVQNMYLTATAHGIGCYWSTGAVTYLEESKPHFDLGEHDILLGFLYIGMVDMKEPMKSKRNPISEKITWVKE